MITIQKVTSNVQSVPHQSPDIYWHSELFLKTVFSIARSTFRMCSAMAIFNSSIVWGLFEYTEFFIAPQRKKIGQRKIHQGQGDTRLTLTPSVIPNSKYVTMVGDWNCLKYCIFAYYLYCNRQVHRDFLITLYIIHKRPQLYLKLAEIFC